MRLTLNAIAEKVGGRVKGDGSVEITGVAKIENAREGEITFLANPKYVRYLKDAKASAVIVSADIQEAGNLPLLVVPNPYYAFLKAVLLFNPQGAPLEKGVHSQAIVGEDTQVGEDVAIGPFVVIGKRCRIGRGSILMPLVWIGDDVVVGEDCLLYPHSSLREKIVLGNRVILHCGVVVGSDGFGYAPEGGRYHKIPQIGTVVIEDDVEIGTNSTIDRATLGETRIGRGVKLDNLIHVGHNCTIGEDTVMAAQTGLSGSTHIGKGVRVGGQVGFAGHLIVGDGATIGAQSGVSKTVPPGVMVSGYPAQPHQQELRTEASLRKLPEMLKEWKELKVRLEELEKHIGKT